MSQRPAPSAEERLFLIFRGGPPPAPEVPAQPARIRRSRQTAVDNVAPPPVGWTPPPWPSPIDHELALTAHARRVRGGSLVTTALEEL